MDVEPVEVVRLGLMRYEDAWAWQRARAEAVRAGDAPEAIALVQHPPVYTLGMRGRTASIPLTDDEAAALGAAVVHSDRGGDVTFHGPGQLVVYPILDTQRRGLGPGALVRDHIRTIKQALARFGIEGETVEGRPGVWVRDGEALAKIAAIGVRIRHGVSTHGFALNVSTDLDWFGHIVPCGIADAGVTSMARVLGTPPPLESVEAALLEAFEQVFHVKHIAQAGSS